MKECTKCRESKPLEEFHKDNSKRDGLYPRCKECKRLDSKVSFKKNYDKNKEAIRARNDDYRKRNLDKVALRQKIYALNNKDKVQAKRIKHMYNITIDEYNRKLEEQEYVCAICKRPNASGHSLSIDHDHSCCPGEKSCGICVRGLLCKKCNFGIGNFSDDEDRMRAALDYIQYHRRATTTSRHQGAIGI